MSGKAHESLCFSLVLTSRIDAERAFHWSFVAALALAQALDTAIKWPNDLYRERRKVGGILATLEAEQTPSVILGIGLNLTFDPSARDPSLNERAASLGTSDAVVPALLGRLLLAIERERLRLHWQDGPAALGRTGAPALGAGRRNNSSHHAKWYHRRHAGRRRRRLPTRAPRRSAAAPRRLDSRGVAAGRRGLNMRWTLALAATLCSAQLHAASVTFGNSKTDQILKQFIRDPNTKQQPDEDHGYLAPSGALPRAAAR